MALMIDPREFIINCLLVFKESLELYFMFSLFPWLYNQAMFRKSKVRTPIISFVSFLELVL